MKLIALVVGIVVGIVLLAVMLQAQGSPAQPGEAISTALNPQVAQTIQLTFTSSVYGLVAPNGLFQFGGHFVYSVTSQPNTSQVAYLASSVSLPLQVTSVSNSLDQLTATATVSIPALCSGAACESYIDNLTVSSYVVLNTYVAFWVSPTTTVIFSNSPIHGVTTSLKVNAQSASPNGFYYEFYAFLVLLIALELLIAAFTLRSAWLALPGIALFVAFVVLAGVWTLLPG
jgi:hypothetical protein